MVGWLLTGGALVGAWLMLWLLARFARKRGHTPQRWHLSLVMGWAFIWALERILSESLLQTPVTERAFTHEQLIGAALVLCVVVYGIVAVWMWRAPVKQEVWKQIEEIGKEKD